MQMKVPEADGCKKGKKGHKEGRKNMRIRKRTSNLDFLLLLLLLSCANTSWLCHCQMPIPNSNHNNNHNNYHMRQFQHGKKWKKLSVFFSTFYYI